MFAKLFTKTSDLNQLLQESAECKKQYLLRVEEAKKTTSAPLQVYKEPQFPHLKQQAFEVGEACKMESEGVIMRLLTTITHNLPENEKNYILGVTLRNIQIWFDFTLTARIIDEFKPDQKTLDEVFLNDISCLSDKFGKSLHLTYLNCLLTHGISQGAIHQALQILAKPNHAQPNNKQVIHLLEQALTPGEKLTKEGDNTNSSLCNH